MALASLPILSVTAEEQFAPGDVDMDGYITGHDAALVSRHLMYGDNNLSAEQLKLADINGDGEVTQADADAIFEKQEYQLGDTNLDGTISLDDAFAALMEYSYSAAGNTEKMSLSLLQKNLSDMNGMQNAVPTMDNAFVCVNYYACRAVGRFEEIEETYGKGVCGVKDKVCYYYLDLDEIGELEPFYGSIIGEE